MDDARKTKAALIDQLKRLRARVKKLERLGQRRQTPGKPAARSIARKNANARNVAIQSSSINITHRKLEEEALRSSNERFATVFRASPVSIAITRLEDNRLVEVNRTWLSMTGFSEAEAIGHTSTELNILVDATERGEVLRKLREGEKMENFEVLLRRKSGEIANALLSAELIEFGGEPCLLTLAQDITERRQAEKGLSEREERYRKLVEESPEAIAVQCEGTLVYVNPAGAKLIGAQGPEELIGKSMFDFIHPQDRDGARKRLKQLAFGQVFRSIEERLVKLDGTMLDVETTSIPTEYQGKPAAQVIVRDITERKRTEADLKQVLEWQQAIFEGSRDAIFISDQDSCFVAVNNAACKLTGYSREELLNKRIPDIHNLSDLTAYNTYKQRILDGEEILSEAKILRSDGTTVDTEFNNRRMLISGKPYMHTTARDITERKRVEEELALLAHAIRSIGECVSVTDTDNKILFVNDAFLKTYGYTVDELIGKPISIVRSTTTKPASDEISAATVKGAWQGELVNRKKDGTDFTIGLSTSIVRNDEGRVLGLIGIATDITERKRAEDELRKERELLLTVIEAIPDEICLKDTDSRFVLANKASVAALGAKSLEEMIGKTDLDYVRSEMALRHLAEEKAILESGKPAISRERVRLDPKTGEIKKCDLSTKVPVKDHEGHAIGLLVINRDITERKQAEEALRESEERYRDLVEHSHDIICTHDMEGNLLSINPAATKVSGFTEAELVGKNLREFLAPTGRRLFESYLARIQAMGSASGLLPVITKSGEKRIWEYFNTMRSEGVPVPIVRGLARDITERKRAEDRLIASQEQLHRLAGHLQSVREEERKHLSQEFHDQLGQTLTALKMDLALLQRELADKTREISRLSLAESIRSMYGLIDGGTQMIREIMSELHPELLDQLGLVAALEWEAERFQKRSGLKCRFISELGEFQFDPKKSIALFRIFQEAVTNVARHAQATTVEVSVRRENNDVVLEIKDNGIGIEANADHKAGSFGLIGMRERAILLGGKLEITSIMGKGTTVLVRMPYVPTLPNGGDAP